MSSRLALFLLLFVVALIAAAASIAAVHIGPSPKRPVAAPPTTAPPVPVCSVADLRTSVTPPIGSAGTLHYDNVSYSAATGVHALAYDDSGVLPYGDAAPYGAPISINVSSPVVGMARTHDGKGYWLVTADGSVYSYGDATYYGGANNLPLYAPIVGITATPDGRGYWLYTLDGEVFSYGGAGFYGSAGDIKLNQPIVGMAADPSGQGYWLVASDGGVFAYGKADFFGSMGGKQMNAPVVGMAVAPGGKGYWLAGADGGVFAFGSATFDGSLGNVSITGWVSGIAAIPDSSGYWLANADGDVYDFGDAQFFGDNLGAPRTEPIAQIVSTPDGCGYWLLEPDAFPTVFSHPAANSEIVNIASSQVEADPDTGYDCNPYGPCEGWCALFVTWVWEQAGVPIPSYAFVGDIYHWAAATTAVLPPTASPSPGDAVLYGAGPTTVTTAVHTGIVAQVWPDGAIDTVQGNAGPAPQGAQNVVLNGPFLPSDSIVYNGFPIFGFAVP